jgi:hypothetical protein
MGAGSQQFVPSGKKIQIFKRKHDYKICLAIYITFLTHGITDFDQLFQDL